MFTNETQPLELAARVLMDSTIWAVMSGPFNSRGRAILDRWAVNSPQALKFLEARGVDCLKARLGRQQRLEEVAVWAFWDANDDSLADHEILALAGITIDLDEFSRGDCRSTGCYQ